MNAILFRIKTKRWPTDDDLERVNCKDAGNLGHMFCGWCEKHDKPRFECLCDDYRARLDRKHIK